ncbi:NAD-dependent epimerase/dehydratase family protein [Cytobacillus gottheilii]|uniref:NAD-dependent epimerase/dehydratase family protein n=1 Tax=Cytobacillus gottheilii TaxID=859144 RepID=A0ABX8F6P8_9BACI|nr:NAD-dependent epimerase/dehydratase family protein [Cytobacillus gottheilii]QVY59770.1 NAD-dependent epimerase/dehydratase family protein [Cytobacillus gottheilii]
MKMVVTGATGFLGQKLAVRLAQLGHDVIGLGRNEQAGRNLQRSGIWFKQVELSNRQDVLDACQNADYVFHCGALSSPWGKYEDFYQANVMGTKHIIEACQMHGIKRLIHVSTPSIYFYYDERKNVKEDDVLPQSFVNEYAQTKFLAEKEVDEAFRNGLPVITIRPRAIFGPGDQAILPRLIRVCEKGALPKIGNEKVEVDVTYVENVVDALLLCMSSGNHTLGQKYNITNGVNVDLYGIVEKVMDQLGKPVRYKKISEKTAFTIAKGLEFVFKHFLRGREPVLTRYTVSVLSKSQTLNIEKAKAELGYQPRVSVEEGMLHFTEWWKENNGN